MNRSLERGLEIKKSPEGPYGYNVQIDIDVARHGRKAEANSQTITNPEETAQIGTDLDLSGIDLVAVRTTPVPRAVQSGVLVAEGMRKNLDLMQETVNVRISKRPTGILSTEGTNVERILANPDQLKDINMLSPKIREGYAKAVQESEGSTLGQENAGVEYFVSLMDTDLAALTHTRQELKIGEVLSQDALQEITRFKETQDLGREGGMSVLEVVLRMVGHFIKHYSEVSNRSKSDSRTLIYEVNHSGFMEPFLLYLLKEDILADPIATGSTALEQLGGAFRPNEGFRISLLREKKDGDVTLNFIIRGKVYSIDPKSLQTMLAGNDRLLSCIQSYE